MKQTRWLSGIDWTTIVICLLIICFGVMNIYSVDPSKGTKQLVFFGIAMAAVFSLVLINTVVKNFFQTNSWVFYVLSVLALAGLFVFGKDINGARAWYSFGSFSIQPVEFAKIATALFMANFLKFNPNGLSKFSFTLQLLIVMGIPIALILMQPDVGSVLVFFCFIIAMYREGLHWSFLVVPILGVVIFLINITQPPLAFLVVLNFIFLISALVFFLIINTRANPKWVDIFKGIFLSLGFSFLIILLSVVLMKDLPLLGVANKMLPNQLFFGTNISLWYYVFLSLIGLVFSFLVFFLLKKDTAEPKNNPFSVTDGKQQYTSLVFLSSLTLLVTVYVISLSSNIVFEFLPTHHKERLLVLFEGEEKYRLTKGYNLLYSKTAIGSGELLGKGYQLGTVKRGSFVPEQSTDYIFCTVGEEWGFVGSTILVLLYVFLILRLYWLAEHQTKVFNRFFGYSVASIILIHFAINIGMVTGLFPTVGIPLPFFSYGGSSLLGFCLLLGVFLILSYDSKQKLY